MSYVKNMSVGWYDKSDHFYIRIQSRGLSPLFHYQNFQDGQNPANNGEMDNNVENSQIEEFIANLKGRKGYEEKKAI